MSKEYFLRAGLTCLVVAPLAFAASCSGGNDEGGAQVAKEGNGEASYVRLPDENILGEVSPEGMCDPSVVDIDHERPTAHITYHGQPGDMLEIKISHRSESGHIAEDVQYVEMSSTQIEAQVPTVIQNEDIYGIHVVANGGVGKSGECHIPVNGIEES